MKSSRKQFKFEILIDRYFSNFLRILCTNLMFFVPLCIAAIINLFLSRLTSGILIPVVSVLLFTLVFPFYAGVVLVCRNIARGDEDVKVFSTFLSAVKGNFLRFLLYGFLISGITYISVSSISFYAKLLSSSWIFYVMLFICVIILLMALFISFYVPVMTVTFDLPVKYILKNSFLMSFGEIKNNFFALFASIIVLAIAFTILLLCPVTIVVIIVTILLVALILPATCQTVVSFYVFDDMYGTITQKDKKVQKIDDAIVTQKEKRNKTHLEEETEDYSDVDISTLKDTDEYIFYNGKMIKQSVLLKKVLEQRGQASDSENEE